MFLICFVVFSFVLFKLNIHFEAKVIGLRSANEHFYCQNFDEGHLLEPVRSGNLVFPAGQCAEPFIDVEDIVDVVTAALTEEGHREQLYEVTGPELLTFADAVREISTATGRKILYTPVSAGEYASALMEEGMPSEVAGMLGDLFSTILDGRNSHLSDGVQRALGRQPRSFAEYAKRTAASGVWQAPAATKAIA